MLINETSGETLRATQRLTVQSIKLQHRPTLAKALQGFVGTLHAMHISPDRFSAPVEFLARVMSGI